MYSTDSGLNKQVNQMMIAQLPDRKVQFNSCRFRKSFKINFTISKD